MPWPALLVDVLLSGALTLQLVTSWLLTMNDASTVSVEARECRPDDERLLSSLQGSPRCLQGRGPKLLVAGRPILEEPPSIRDDPLFAKV